jgi:signal transduction histidine kinase
MPPYEISIRARDGSEIPVIVKAQAILYRGKLADEVIHIDITERKRAEKALQHSLEETARGQRLLLALSQAAQAVQRARTPEEVHHAVGDEVAKLGYHVAVLGLTDDQASLAISHMTFEPALVRAAEKLAGVSAPKFRLPLVPGSFLQRLMAEGGTIFAPTSEFIAKVLPAPLHLLATSLTALLGVRQSIAAPLQVGGKAHGLLVVNGTDLTEADVPAVTAFANQAAIAIENARLFEQVQAGREQLRRLADQIISAQEAERQRVSRELHDEAGQSLTALKVSLELLLADLPAEAEFLRQSLARTVDLTGKTMQHIRLLAHDLRPPALEAIGVNATLEDLCSDFAERTRLSIVYQGEEIPGLTDAASISLYRFLQEALTNVVKHADARQVHVTLSQGVGEACLAVADDGRGFDLSAALVDPRPKGLGLVAMRERIQMLGGRVEAKSWPGQGSRLVAHVPFKTFWKEKDR